MTATLELPAVDQEFTEYSAQRGKLRVNLESNVIHDVKILGAKSDNGRYYTESAMRNAVGLYEGAKVNVGHNTTGERPYEDRMGNIRNVTVREGSLYGDFHYNPKHRLVDQLLWDAEHSPGNVGFSPHARVKARLEKGVQVVESITSVTSVDLVANPATTRGLFESKDHQMSEQITLEAVRASKEVYDAVIAEHTACESVQKDAKELADLRKKVADFEAKEAADALRETILGEVKAAKLDPSDERAVSKVFIESLLSESDAEARQALIADRAELLKGVAPSNKPKSVSQVITESSDTPHQVDPAAVANRYRMAR